LDEITKESLKTTLLLESMERLLLVLPRIIWQLFVGKSGIEENQQKAHFLCEKLLRVLLECVSVDASTYKPDTWSNIASKITALFYFQTKSPQKKLLGPFLGMSAECKRLTLQVITMLPSETLPESLLKAIAICSHILVWRTTFERCKSQTTLVGDNSILPDLLSVPFLREKRYMPLDDLLSYAVTVLWGFDAKIHLELGIFDGVDLKSDKDIIKRQYEKETCKIHSMIYRMLQQVSSVRCTNVFTYMEPIFESLARSRLCPDSISLLSRSFDDSASDCLNFDLMCDLARVHSFLSCIGQQRRKEDKKYEVFLKSKLGRLVADVLVCQMYVGHDHGSEFFTIISPTEALITDTICAVIRKGGELSFEVALAWTEALHDVLSSVEQIDGVKSSNAKQVLTSLKARVESEKGVKGNSIIDRVVSELSLWGVK